MTNTKPDYIQSQLDRVKNLEVLYIKDGRHNPSHPFHALYTGLYTQSQNENPAQC